MAVKDNYNILQSLEMRKRGISVVVPYQERQVSAIMMEAGKPAQNFLKKEETYREI